MFEGLKNDFSSMPMLYSVIVVALVVVITLLWTYVRAIITNMAALPSGPVNVTITNPGVLLEAEKQLQAQKERPQPINQA